MKALAAACALMWCVPALAEPPPEAYNEVSVFGAPTLSPGTRGFGVFLGFPVFGLRAAVGATERFDVGLGFDSLYGVMNEVRVLGRYQWLRTDHWSGAFALEAGKAFFSQKPSGESRGARWLTGRRNYNILPGVVFSYRG